MATAKKRKLDSISDGPAPSEPEAKRHHTTNRCRLTELPDELLILIAEHLAGFDSPITYVHRMDGKLIIEHPKSYHDVSLAGLRDLSDTLYVEFEKALHSNGIVTFEDQHSFVEYFDSEVLNSDPRLMSIRLATQHMRFNIWKLDWSRKLYSAMKLLVNLKKVHLGGAWKSKDDPLMFTPTKFNASYFKYSASNMIHLLELVSLKNAILHTTFGPGCFGRNTIYSSESGHYYFDCGFQNKVNHAALGELLAVWNEDQNTLASTSSIVPMGEEILSGIMKYVDSTLARKGQK